MKKLSFQEKNNLIVKHKNGEYFSKDLELFKKHCPGHALNNELAKANKFSYARLDGLMLSYLLDIVSIDDIQKNRTQEKQPELEPRTEDEIRTLLIEQFELDEADLEALSGIIPLWLDKTDEEIISAVQKLLGEKTIQGEGSEDGDKGEATGEGNQGEQTEDETSSSQASGEGAPLLPIERDNVKTFVKRINEATTIQVVEAIMKEDTEGGERISVQKAGQKRIDILIAPQEDLDGKKKDQSMTNSQV